MDKTSHSNRITRVQFAKAVAGVIGGSIGAYLLYEMAPWMNARTAANKARQPFQPGATGSVPIREMIRYATLAASGHNAQPWKFIVKDHTIEIHPDETRRLSAVDPDERELWISLGCALENLTIAARQAGFEPETTYPGTESFFSVHLASARPEGNPLFDAIPPRQNTRSEYDGQKLTKNETDPLMSISKEEGISLVLLDGPTHMNKVLDYVTVGNRNQFEDKPFVEELIHWIRFDKREAMTTMDGLYTSCMDNPQVPRWIGQQVVGRMSSQQQTDSDAKKLRSSAGAIAIASTTDDKAAWVRTGQVYQRLALKMTSVNLKSAFLNQPIEVPAVRKQFQDALGFGPNLPQLLLRYGYADPMPSSLRRSIDDVIVWS